MSLEGDDPSFNSINDSPRETVKGLTVLTAAVFIVGEMSGTGVLSLPNAMNESTWAGLVLIFGCCAISGYCGIRLSTCWTMILEKKRSASIGTREPFPLIAYEAGGKFARYLVVLSSYLQLIGVAVIFLLIASNNIAEVLSVFVLRFCDYTIIITLVMWPIAMLGTPKDFWPIAVGAMVCTGIACLLLFVQTIRQIPDPLPEPSPITFQNFFVAFGTILFCFGGAVMFPTIQTDMIKPQMFYKSVIISYIVMLIFYLPVAVGGYLVFARNTKENIIENMDENWIKTTIIVLITGHVLTAFTIILNPVFQACEQLANAPPRFTIKRFLIRTAVLILVLFIAQSIPNFGPILSFIGGSAIALTSFILPCVFYVLLCRKSEYARQISKLELTIIIFSVTISVCGGIAATYSSVDKLFSPTTFVPPCYLNRTQ